MGQRTIRISFDRMRSPKPSSLPHPKARFYHSIRFRLTAWYAFMLMLILLVVGVALARMLAQTLEDDLEERLEVAATAVFKQAERSMRTSDTAADPVGDISPQPTNVGSILVAGTWAEIYGPRGNHLSSSGNPPNGRPAVDPVELGQSGSSLTTHRFSTDGTGMQAVILYPGGAEQGRQRTIGAVMVGESREPMERTLNVVNRTLRIAGLAGLVVAIGLGWLLAGRALAPVERITRSALEIERRQDLATVPERRLEVPPTGDELAHLAAAFNSMLDRIETAFGAQRRFVADASHELRTPLTAIRGNIDVLLRHLHSGRPLPEDELTEALTDIRRESARMNRLVEDLLLLARSDIAEIARSVQREPVRLDLIAQEAFRTGESLRSDQQLILRADQPVMLEGDRDRLTQVILILLDNALRHTPNDGRVSLAVETGWNEGTHTTMARLTVSDTGEGIPPEHQPHLFERFYRVEGSRSRFGGGSGLGLSIAQALVVAHGGQIEIHSEPGRGAAFTVWLPLPTPEAASHAHGRRVEPQPAVH